MRELQFHDVPLGEPLPVERIAAEAYAMRQSPGLLALLQHLRNESGRLQADSFDEAKAGNQAAALLHQGGAQALKDMWVEVVKWTRERKEKPPA